MTRALESAFSGPRARWTLGVFLVVLLGTAAAWTWVRLTTKQGYPAYAEDPVAYDGTFLVLSIFRVDEVFPGDGYVVEKGFLYVPVQGPTDDLAVGQEVSVGGVFRGSDGVVVEDWHEVHHLRWAKKALGVIGLGLIGVGFPFLFRVRRDGLVSRG